ncbi:hypothetical protein B0H13DRAFT_2336639 [Mycena leptocephala]|nr:hypothetical protein B0H13DRAFT_2336639 [Mycena leptocephala]
MDGTTRGHSGYFSRADAAVLEGMSHRRALRAPAGVDGSPSRLHSLHMSFRGVLSLLLLRSCSRVLPLSSCYFIPGRDAMPAQREEGRCVSTVECVFFPFFPILLPPVPAIFDLHSLLTFLISSGDAFSANLPPSVPRLSQRKPSFRYAMAPAASRRVWRSVRTDAAAGAEIVGILIPSPPSSTRSTSVPVPLTPFPSCSGFMSIVLTFCSGQRFLRKPGRIPGVFRLVGGVLVTMRENYTRAGDARWFIGEGGWIDVRFLSPLDLGQDHVGNQSDIISDPSPKREMHASRSIYSESLENA